MLFPVHRPPRHVRDQLVSQLRTMTEDELSAHCTNVLSRYADRPLTVQHRRRHPCAGCGELLPLDADPRRLYCTKAEGQRVRRGRV
jgi:hypothetical protein